MVKHTNTLREISKFLSGLVAADLMMGIWLYAKQMLPIAFFGLTITPQLAVFWMAFDAVLFLLLLHYGWRIKIPPSSWQKTSLTLVGILLGIISIMHLLRLIFGVEINIGGWNAPFWLSWFGTVITAYLSYASFHFAGHK